MFNRCFVFLIILLIVFPCSTRAQSNIACDIVIDPGHGGIDGGAAYRGILEKEINLKIGKRLDSLLRSQGYVVKMTRNEDYALSDENPSKFGSRHRRDLQRRKWIADALQPKLFLSLHLNWSKKRSYRGPIVIYQARNLESYHFAQLAQKHLNTIFGSHRLPVEGKPYYLLNHLNVPTVIIEMGFLSNSSDIQMLKDSKVQEQISMVLTQSINEYFHIRIVEAQGCGKNCKKLF